MANTRDLRRRIRSVANTMQLTRAMKMVSAARLRRAQQAIVRARPYAWKMGEILRSLAMRADPAAHPLLAEREVSKVEVIVVTGDRGLCGSFNASIIRRAEQVIEEEEAAGRTVSLQCVGKKGRDWFRRRRALRRERPDFFRKIEYSDSADIARELAGLFVAGELDSVVVVYNEFKSALQQRVIVERLLPIEREDVAPGETSEDYIYEPDAVTLLADLLPRYVEWELHRAFLESAAAEQAARMTAMDSASRNAQEMIEQLTLYMNRVRQASITREIIEVVSGAQALG